MEIPAAHNSQARHLARRNGSTDHSLNSCGGMVGATGIEPVTPSMSTRCSPAELRALQLSDGLGFYIGSKAGRQGCLAGVWIANQAASILFTSLTNSRRWTGLDSTLGFFGASESGLSATAAKPVMNMILMLGSGSQARRARSMPPLSGITISVSSIS